MRYARVISQRYICKKRGESRLTMTNEELYQSKKHTMHECMDTIRSGDVIALSGAANEPMNFLHNVGYFSQRVEDVTIIKPRDTDKLDYLYDPDTLGHVHSVSHFFDPSMRHGHRLGLAEYVPADLHNFMELRLKHQPCNIFWALTGPMDENGNFCISYGQQVEREAKACCERIILEVSPHFLPVRGAVTVNIREVDMLYESDAMPLLYPPTTASEEEKTICSFISPMIRDGDCVQLGWGGLPNLVADSLTDKNDLGIHSEVFTTNMAKLVKSGVATGKHKQIDTGRHVAAFVMGSEELYGIASETEAFQLAPCSYVNDPRVICQNDNVVSVNTCIEVDLTGQICSESIGPDHYSGTGGACDFAFGALHSKGGRGIIAFVSTTKNHSISKIKACLTPGSAVSIPRNYADMIVTEYGVAHLRGRTVRERAEALIAVAHPDFRAQLRSEAKTLGIL